MWPIIKPILFQTAAMLLTALAGWLGSGLQAAEAGTLPWLQVPGLLGAAGGCLWFGQRQRAGHRDNQQAALDALNVLKADAGENKEYRVAVANVARCFAESEFGEQRP